MRPDQASAIVVAAGQGSRMGGVSKTLLPINGRPVIARALDAAQQAELAGEIVLVASADALPAMQQLADAENWPKLTRIVLGGARRQDSVAAGLAVAVGEIIAIHDGARPFASAAIFDACITEATRTGAAISAIPVVDTLKRVEGRTVASTLDRTGIWAAQTPQAFRRTRLIDAFDLTRQRGIDVTDEAMLMELIGQPVSVIEGSRWNLKITHPGDLELAQAFASVLDKAAT